MSFLSLCLVRFGKLWPFPDLLSQAISHAQPQSRTGPSPELARVQNGTHNVAPRRARGTPSKGPLGLEQGKLVSLLRFLQPSGRHPALV